MELPASCICWRSRCRRDGRPGPKSLTASRRLLRTVLPDLAKQAIKDRITGAGNQFNSSIGGDRTMPPRLAPDRSACVLAACRHLGEPPRRRPGEGAATGCPRLTTGRPAERPADHGIGAARSSMLAETRCCRRDTADGETLSMPPSGAIAMKPPSPRWSGGRRSSARSTSSAGIVEVTAGSAVSDRRFRANCAARASINILRCRGTRQSAALASATVIPPRRRLVTVRRDRQMAKPGRLPGRPRCHRSHPADPGEAIAA